MMSNSLRAVSESLGDPEGQLARRLFDYMREHVRFTNPLDQHPRVNYIPIERVDPFAGGVSLRCDRQLPAVRYELPPFCDPERDGRNFEIRALLNHLLEDEENYRAGRGSTAGLARCGADLKDHGSWFELAFDNARRYFWLSRNGQLLPGRLLSLWQGRTGDYVITLELLLDSDPVHRRRLVGTLSVGDLPHLVREFNHGHTAEAAQSLFADSLSPSEDATVELAARLRIPLNRYQPQFGLGMDVESAGSVLGHWAGVTWLYKLYPDYKRPLEEFARREGLPVSDILARLDPRSFALHFMQPRGSHEIQLEYCWVITEDGTLKLCPFNIQDGNLRKLLVRLAHGRSVFASGTTTVTGLRRVEVLLNSEDYQHSLGGLASPTAGLSEVGDLHEFVAIVFELQAGLLADTVGYRDTNWTVGMSAARLREWGLDDEIGNGLGALGPIFDMDEQSHPSQDSGERPPAVFQTYKDWVKRHPAGSLRQWAKAVLGVKDASPRCAIKAAYRHLSLVCHPDTGGSNENFQALTEALNIMLTGLKDPTI